MQPSHLGGSYAGVGALLLDGGQDVALMPASSSTGMQRTQGGGAGEDEAPAAPATKVMMFRGA